MINGHIGPKALYIYATVQLTTKPTSQTIAKYVPDTNMPIKLGMCGHSQIS